MYLRCRQMLGHFSLGNATVRSSRCNIPRAPCGGWWVGHDVMMWSADCHFAPHSQVGVDADLHLCIVARKRPTPVLTRAGGTAPRTPSGFFSFYLEMIFLLGNDFNTCYAATLICLCACV